MNEFKIIYDTADYSTGLIDALIFIVLGLGLPILLLIFAVRILRNRQPSSSKVKGVVLGVVGLLLFLVGLGALLSNPLATESRRQIENKAYSKIQGQVTNITESTVLAGNPPATFEVSDHIFEYGRGSENFELEMGTKGGLLVEGLSVQIWYNGDKILRIYSTE